MRILGQLERVRVDRELGYRAPVRRMHALARRAGVPRSGRERRARIRPGLRAEVLAGVRVGRHEMQQAGARGRPECGGCAGAVGQRPPRGSRLGSVRPQARGAELPRPVDQRAYRSVLPRDRVSGRLRLQPAGARVQASPGGMRFRSGRRAKGLLGAKDRAGSHPDHPPFGQISNTPGQARHAAGSGG